MQEILSQIWVGIQPYIKEIIVVICTVVLGGFMPKLIQKVLEAIFSRIPYSPVQSMAWGLVRYMAQKYPTAGDLPGAEKAKKIFNEIKEHYPWFPSKELITIIKTQYRLWQGEIIHKKKLDSLEK